MRVNVGWIEGKNRKWVQEEDENVGEENQMIEEIHKRAKRNNWLQKRLWDKKSERGAALDSQTQRSKIDEG